MTHPKKTPDPTLAEIRLLCQRIRRTWPRQRLQQNERHVEAGDSGQWSDNRRFDEFVQGIGWHVTHDGNRSLVSHGGGGPGFKSLMRLYPDENLGIAILVNGTNVEDQEIADVVSKIEW